MRKTHTQYMQAALSLAEKGCYTVSPNPMVGCVIVRDHQIIGSGWHKHAGGAHAEINALINTQGNLETATLYVTLEPCCHTGKTPPCVDQLIQSGIKKIYIACLDPDPRVSGKGVKKLLTGGADVEVGLLEKEARALNHIFFFYHQHKTPFVILKWAMSLDGKKKVNEDDSKQISSPDSQQHTHKLRNQVDAILIGANTAREDDPQLTVRNVDIKPIKHPLRIIVSTDCNLPDGLNLFKKDSVAKTIIATTSRASKTILKKLSAQGVDVLMLSPNKYKQVSLKHLLNKLGERGITSLLVEGGEKIHQSFQRQGLVNQTYVYLAPVMIGDFEHKKTVQNINILNMGVDKLLSIEGGYV